ncbi:hypothetical protein ACFE04_011966 [Oxalis oulophora]
MTESSSMISLLILLLIISQCLSQSLHFSPPKSISINCGETVRSTINGKEWLPDKAFTTVGTPKKITIPVLDPTLSTVRSFPYLNNRHNKFCFDIFSYRGAKHMVRTTYFYGGVNGAASPSPPVFDQIVDGTFWSVVNTTEDFDKGVASYYEGVFVAKGNTMSVCLGVGEYTDSDPFISALEIVILGDSLYNSTNFDKHALRLISRHSFGYSGPIVRYPDDEFDRFWEPFQKTSLPAKKNDVLVSGLWNHPPSKIFDTVMQSKKSEPMEFHWPPTSLPSSNYYIALYFANDQSSSRVLSVSVNGITYFKKLNVTKDGAAVFTTQWPLSGATNITVTPVSGWNSVPSINGGEIFQVLPVGNKTHTGDVIALERVKKSFHNHPIDWSGDPCFPPEYSWTGIKCSLGSRNRVVSLNLTSMGLTGSLSPKIARLTALTDIWLGNNSLSGSIPDLGKLRMLEKLHLEDNQFSGEISSSLGNITGLHELFLQNNNLTGQIPSMLLTKPGLDLRTSGNNLESLSPS